MADSWNAVAHLVDALCQWTTYRTQALRSAPGVGGRSDSPGVLRLGTVTASQNVRSSVNSKESIIYKMEKNYVCKQERIQGNYM